MNKKHARRAEVARLTAEVIRLTGIVEKFEQGAYCTHCERAAILENAAAKAARELERGLAEADKVCLRPRPRDGAV